MASPKPTWRRASRALAVALALGGLFAGPAWSGTAAGDPYPWLRQLRWLDRAPVTAADLEGRVVVVEFWTFECINCLRTVPAMRELAKATSGGDVVLLGMHAPEFERERDTGAVRQAVARLHLSFPIAQDNDFAAWRAFGNQAWPALYVLDRRGRVRARHVGELHVGTPGWTAFLRTLEDLRREKTEPRTRQ